MFSLMYAWTNDWANSPDASDLRHHVAHCDVTVMCNGENKPALYMIRQSSLWYRDILCDSFDQICIGFCWSLGMDKYAPPILYNECNYLSILRLKLTHVSKRCPSHYCGWRPIMKSVPYSHISGHCIQPFQFLTVLNTQIAKHMRPTICDQGCDVANWVQ